MELYVEDILGRP